MPICLPPEFIDEVEKIIDNSTTSIQRTEKLTELFGGNKKSAQEINLAYEKKLLLKNQSNVVNNFIDSFNGIELAQKEEMKLKLARRVGEREGIIQSDELLAIAKDIYDRKYGLNIDPQVVSELNKLKTQADELSFKAKGTADGSAEELAYGRKIVEIENLVGSVTNKTDTMNFLDTIKQIGKETAKRFEGKSAYQKVLEGGKLIGEVATSAIYKSVQASMDMSVALRQGFKVLTSNPAVWRKNFIEAFKPFMHMGNKAEQTAVFNEFKARLVSSKLYREAINSKLAIGVIEEFFPTTLAEKIPILGRIFKASNESFTIFSQGSRMGLFADMRKSLLASGAELTPELMSDVAKLANSITGRGNLGKLESASGIVNKLFYSGRFIKSQVDTFMLPFSPSLSPEVRKMAMISSAKNLGTIGTLMYTASLFTDVEMDPTSSKFGKFKVPGSNDTWVDLTGGLGSYITLAGRIATQKSKSSTTGKVTALNTGEFGSQTTWDVLLNWGTNKLAPAPSTLVSVLKGKDFSGNKPTVSSVVANLNTPITINNALQIFQNEDKSTALIATMFDVLGAAQTDYSKFKK